MNNTSHLLINSALIKITGLKSPTVPVEESPEIAHLTQFYLKREYGILPPKDSDSSDEDLRNREEHRDDMEIPNILDLMGIYKYEDDGNPKESSIVLFTEVIWRVARKLNVPYHILKEKVLIHETAHAVTHLGKDAQGRIWDNFSKAMVKDKEYYAQIYTHLLFRDAKSGDELGGYLSQMKGDSSRFPGSLYKVEEYRETMKTLLTVQPERYKTWQEDEDKTTAEINLKLEATRAKSRPI